MGAAPDRELQSAQWSFRPWCLSSFLGQDFLQARADEPSQAQLVVSSEGGQVTHLRALNPTSVRTTARDRHERD